MRSLIVQIAAVSLAVSFAAGCSDGTASKEQSPPAADSGAKAGSGVYPLATCVVSGEDLGSMGDPYIHTHEGREVRFCCKACLKKFSAEPGKYLAKLDEAGKK